MKKSVILCPATLTIGLLSSKWKAHILAHIGLQNDGIRFGELSRLVPKISRRMLTQSLNELVDDGLLYRTEHLQIPPKVVYSLTELGEEVQEVISLLAKFGSKYIERNKEKIIEIYGDKEVEAQLKTAKKIGWM